MTYSGERVVVTLLRKRWGVTRTVRRYGYVVNNIDDTLCEVRYDGGTYVTVHRANCQHVGP